MTQSAPANDEEVLLDQLKSCPAQGHDGKSVHYSQLFAIAAVHPSHLLMGPDLCYLSLYDFLLALAKKK